MFRLPCWAATLVVLVQAAGEPARARSPGVPQRLPVGPSEEAVPVIRPSQTRVPPAPVRGPSLEPAENSRFTSEPERNPTAPVPSHSPPGYGNPGNPAYGNPGNPAYGNPGNPGYGNPESPRYGNPGMNPGDPRMPEQGQGNPSATRNDGSNKNSRWKVFRRKDSTPTGGDVQPERSRSLWPFSRNRQ